MRLSRLLIISIILLSGQPIAIGQLKYSLVEKENALDELKMPALSRILQSSEESSKSILLAAVYSLVLPGVGELYAENFESGKYFLIADGGLWLTYAGFQLHGTWLRDDARSFARQHAGTEISDKDQQFEVNIGNFNTVAEYNEAKLRNRQYDLLYDPNSSYRWSWNSDINRMKYRDLRIRSDEVFQNSRFIVGALVINRLISAFSAGRAAALHNKARQVQTTWRLNASIDGGLQRAHGILVNVSKDF